MTVHLTGRVCDMGKIMTISNKYNIPIIEDAAQAIGSKYQNKFAGSFWKSRMFFCSPIKKSKCTRRFWLFNNKLV